MTEEHTVLTGDAISGRGGSVNPFVVVDDATAFIAFAIAVFAATEVEEARTPTPDGKLIHAELRLGDSLILLADRLDGWPAHPGLFQVWVGDVRAVSRRAVELGATMVTPATPFYGAVTLARFVDPWQNLWWLYAPTPGQPDPRPAWEGGSTVVFETIDEHMRTRKA